MFYDRIYVAATSQHVGKTTTTLGLVHALKNRGLNVGYCKPVGQKALRYNGGFADKDALLFADVMKFKAQCDIHSPVIIGKGATRSFLDDPSKFNFENRIIKASKILQQRHEIVVYEGTGHPGVGSVVNLSNARVAQMLGARLIMIVEAGIGSTIDSLDLNLSVFQQKNIPIAGVIINKTIPSKMDMVRHYVGKKLAERDIELLGVIPYEEILGLPLMSAIVKSINGEVLYNEEHLDRRVEDILAGSLIDREDIKESGNKLLVVSISRLDDALSKIDRINQTLSKDKKEECPLSGVILTGGKGDIKPAHLNYFLHNKVPVVHSKIDTYESVIKISRIEVKINTKTPWKVKKAVELFEEYVNLDPLLASQE